MFLLRVLMTSANKSLEKKNFHRVENFIKQLVHTSAVRSSRYVALGEFGARKMRKRRSLEQLVRIFRAPQTSQVLHISMNARWRMNQLLIITLTSTGHLALLVHHKAHPGCFHVRDNLFWITLSFLYTFCCNEFSWNFSREPGFRIFFSSFGNANLLSTIMFAQNSTKHQRQCTLRLQYRHWEW